MKSVFTSNPRIKCPGQVSGGPELAQQLSPGSQGHPHEPEGVSAASFSASLWLFISETCDSGMEPQGTGWTVF
jgi:hypothetical protein